jgi:hypothetical protein
MLGDVRRNAATERGEKVEHRSMRDYAELIPENGAPLDFAKYPFQIEPFYSDEIADAEESVVMKATQIGCSSGAIRWAVRRCDQFGETVIYFFPTQTHVKEFGNERLEPSIAASTYLSERIPRGHTRNKSQKHIGLGFLNLRGMQSKAAVQSIAASAVVIDDYDDAPSERIAEAEQRLGGAEGSGRVGRVRRIGRPSIPGFGIAAAFEESDKRLWMVTCPECGDVQSIEFAANLRWRSAAGGDRVLRAGQDEFEIEKDVTEAWRACRACDVSLENAPLCGGVWTPTKLGPGRVPGFHIPRTIVPLTNLKKIIIHSRSKQLTRIENFHHADLGVPYAAADARLTDEDLNRARIEGVPSQMTYRGHNPVVLGVDIASERDLSACSSEVLPSGIRRAIRTWEPESFEEVARAMGELRVHIAVVDSMPDRRAARALQRDFPGRVFLLEYDDKPKADPWVFDDKREIIRVNRTEAIDAMMEAIRSVTSIPNSPAVPNYDEQMKSPVRRVELDTKERPVRRYVPTGTQGDDYAHAETYALVAQQFLGAVMETQAQAQQGDMPIEADEPVQLGYGNVRYRGGLGV